MELETVAQMWRSYESNVMPKDPSPIQVQETRRAFYAGALALFNVASYGIGAPSVSSEDGVAYLERIETEMNAFFIDEIAAQEGRKQS